VSKSKERKIKEKYVAGLALQTLETLLNCQPASERYSFTMLGCNAVYFNFTVLHNFVLLRCLPRKHVEILERHSAVIGIISYDTAPVLPNMSAEIVNNSDLYLGEVPFASQSELQ
jgi:hypothetical protein